MSIDFQDLLNKPAGAAEKPKPFPVGHYTATAIAYEMRKIGQKETAACEIEFELTGACADVDQDDYEEAGGDAKLTTRKLKSPMWITEDSLWRVDKQLEEMGIDLAGRPYGEVFEDIPGCDVVLEIEHRASADGEEIYMQVKNVRPADFEIE